MRLFDLHCDTIIECYKQKVPLRENRLRRLPDLHPQDCIQCGCCSYICPAGIPLIELVRQAGEALEKGGTA